MDSHYVNTFNVPIQGKVYVNIWTVPSVIHEAIPFLDNNTNISVQPFDTRTTEKLMIFATRAEILFLTTHMHKRGVLFETWFDDGAGPAWQISQTTDWQHPPNMRFSPPLSFQPGAGIRYTTTHHNDHPTDGPKLPALTFGLTSDDDMAIIAGYYYVP